MKKHFMNVYSGKIKHFRYWTSLWLYMEFWSVLAFCSINFGQETTEFDLHFEKVYKWAAMKVEEKENFIASLWRVSLISAGLYDA